MSRYRRKNYRRGSGRDERKFVVQQSRKTANGTIIETAKYNEDEIEMTQEILFGVDEYPDECTCGKKSGQKRSSITNKVMDFDAIDALAVPAFGFQSYRGDKDPFEQHGTYASDRLLQARETEPDDSNEYDDEPLQVPKFEI